MSRLLAVLAASTGVALACLTGLVSEDTWTRARWSYLLTLARWQAAHPLAPAAADPRRGAQDAATPVAAREVPVPLPPSGAGASPLGSLVRTSPHPLQPGRRLRADQMRMTRPIAIEDDWLPIARPYADPAYLARRWHQAGLTARDKARHDAWQEPILGDASYRRAARRREMAGAR